jgi:hypothetical protein
VKVERDLIVVKTYKGKDCTLGLMKGSSVIFWFICNSIFKVIKESGLKHLGKFD